MGHAFSVMRRGFTARAFKLQVKEEKREKRKEKVPKAGKHLSAV